jgi:drug/metabolite transporter (DMT)-like permease
MQPRLRGTLFAFSGILLIVTQDAVTKTLVASLTPEQITALRSLAAVPMIYLAARLAGIAGALKPRSWRINLLRSVFALAVSLLIIWALAVVPFAEAIALTYTAPFFTLALSPFFLREHPSWLAWLAVVLGFAGALLIVKPFGAGFSPAMLVPVAAALALAGQDIVTRRAHRTESSISILFVTQVVATLGGFLMLPIRGITAMSTETTLLVALAAAMSAAAHGCTIRSLSLIAAADLAPLRYAGLVWATLLGWMFWSEIPDALSMLGGVAIVVAGFMAIRAPSAAHDLNARDRGPST